MGSIAPHNEINWDPSISKKVQKAHDTLFHKIRFTVKKQKHMKRSDNNNDDRVVRVYRKFPTCPIPASLFFRSPPLPKVISDLLLASKSGFCFSTENIDDTNQ